MGKADDLPSFVPAPAPALLTKDRCAELAAGRVEQALDTSLVSRIDPPYMALRPAAFTRGSLLCLDGFHRRCCDSRARFRQAAVGSPDQAPPGPNRAKYHPPRRRPPSVSGPGAAFGPECPRVGSSWAHTASIHRLRVRSGRRSSSTGAHHFDPGIVGKGRSGAEEADCRRARIRNRCRGSPSPRSARRPVPNNRAAQKRRQRDLPCPRTESSNPFPSSEESANHRFRRRFHGLDVGSKPPISPGCAGPGCRRNDRNPLSRSNLGRRCRRLFAPDRSNHRDHRCDREEPAPLQRSTSPSWLNTNSG